MRTSPVRYGPDGSVLRFPYPCRNDLFPTDCTDGGRDGLGPSMTVFLRPSRPSKRVDGSGYIRSPNLGNFQRPFCLIIAVVSIACHRRYHRRRAVHLKIVFMDYLAVPSSRQLSSSN